MELNITTHQGLTRLTFVYPYEEKDAAYEFSVRACDFLTPICGKRINYFHGELNPGEYRLTHVAVSDTSPMGMSFEVEVEITDPAQAALFRMNVEALHARA